MTKKKISLDTLAEELKKLPVEQHFKIKGGTGSTPVTLPTVVVTPSPSPSFPEPSFPSVPSTGGGGESGGGNNDPDPDEGGEDDDSIRDPDGIIENAKEQLEQTRDALENLIEAGQFPPGTTEDDFREYLEQIDKMLETIETMEDSDHTYVVEEGEVDGNANGGVWMDPDTGEIHITVEDMNDLSMLAHELEHIDQIENGDITFDEDGNPVGLSLDDEVEAYQMQHDIQYGAYSGYYNLQGNPVPEGGYEVTPEDVLDAYPEYGDLPEHDPDPEPGSGSSGGPN